MPIKIGMTKEAVIAIYGKPYKESSSIDGSQVLHESLYYKEILFISGSYEINSILHFENSAFKSLEQGKEQLLGNQQKVIVR
jgi:hypothetical protein